MNLSRPTTRRESAATAGVIFRFRRFRGRMGRRGSLIMAVRAPFVVIKKTWNGSGCRLRTQRSRNKDAVLTVCTAMARVAGQGQENSLATDPPDCCRCLLDKGSPVAMIDAWRVASASGKWVNVAPGTPGIRVGCLYGTPLLRGCLLFGWPGCVKEIPR